MFIDYYRKSTRYIVDYRSKDRNVFIRSHYDTYAQYLDDKRRNFPASEWDETIFVWAWDALSQRWHYSELEMED